MNGRIAFDDETLPDGATVTVLTLEGDESFELDSTEEALLMAAIEEAGRGETVDRSSVATLRSKPNTNTKGCTR